MNTVSRQMQSDFGERPPVSERLLRHSRALLAVNLLVVLVAFAVVWVGGLSPLLIVAAALLAAFLSITLAT